MKISYVEHSVYSDLNFRNPAKFYIIDAMLRRVYIHSKLRNEAQEWVNDEYGVGKYTVRCASTEKSSGKETAFGRINSKSRAGMRKPT